MPVHTTTSTGVNELTTLVTSLEAEGAEIVAVLEAGAGWAVVTKKKSPRPPQTRAKAATR